MKTTPEVIDLMVGPDTLTFDEVMRRDPKSLTDAEVIQLIVVARQDRAMWIKGQEAKRMKKAGLPETEDDDDDTVG